MKGGGGGAGLHTVTTGHPWALDHNFNEDFVLGVFNLISFLNS